MSNRRMRAGVVLALFLGVTGTGVAQAPTASEVSGGALSQRISLNLKGVDILDVLKLFSQQSGLNFVAGRNVTGRVTMFINDVDVWEAFEQMISANDLAYERRGAIVTVMQARDYELLYGEKFQARTTGVVVPLRYARGVEVAVLLNQIKSAVGQVVVDEATNTLVLNDVPARISEMRELLTSLDRPTEARVFSLNYAEAEKLKEPVKELLSPVGTFTFDARTNRAVVSDWSEVLAKVDRVVRAFDAPDGQVLIEAKIVNVELTDQMDLGVDWQQLFNGIDLSTRSNFRVLGDIIEGTASGIALKLSTAPKANTRLILEALKKLTKTDVLSNPRIMVSNNQEAKLLVGSKEAVVTVTTTVPATGATVSSPEIQFVDVGTKLFVTPQVKRDGHVQLKIRPEVSSAKIETFQTNRIPIVTSTEAETTVLVKSGVTLIIGGLIERKDTRTESQVPFLSQVPVLGRAFRGSTDATKRTELVVFLTPQIVKSDGSAVHPELIAAPPTGLDPHLVLVPEPVPMVSELVPHTYRDAVREQLEGALVAWFRSLVLPQGDVTIAFTLDPEGQLIGAPAISSPQGEPLILAARGALDRTLPFPPFPADSSAHQVPFRVTVTYTPEH